MNIVYLGNTINFSFYATIGKELFSQSEEKKYSSLVVPTTQLNMHEFRMEALTNAK